ncbi:MAG TPA: four helix bundle protein [Pyrinomonadaceae bacterium]|nr:four helix bundle protein [Pyrinomonadaceae bacterium]
MNYQRFEELPVWQAAIKLAVEIYALTADEAFRGQRSLRDQLERATVSISNNVAEGFERGTSNELLMFLYIARGSAGEVRSMLCLLERLPAFNNLKFEISNLKLQAENISRQLRGWADSLQNSEIKGQRYLTDKTRRAVKEKDEREEFVAELRRMQEENIRKRQSKSSDDE